MRGITQPYKINYVSDASPNFKISHIESKNPQLYWCTSAHCREAFFEIEFPPSKLHSIEVMNMFSPHIEVQAYNLTPKGDVLDEYVCVKSTALVGMNDFMMNKSGVKLRKFTFYDQPNMMNTQFTHMRVTVSNPYHDQKPSTLGLVAFILLVQDKDLKTNFMTLQQQKDKQVTDELRRSIGLDKLDKISGGTTTPVNKNQNSSSPFSFKNRVQIDDSEEIGLNRTPKRSVGRGIDENGTVLKRQWHSMQGNEPAPLDIGIDMRKKMKPNAFREGGDSARRGGLRRYGQQENYDESEEQLKKAIEESKRSYKKEKERWEYIGKPEDLGIGEENKWKGKETGLKSGNKRGGREGDNEERTQDLDDFQKALRESKKTYMEEMGLNPEGVLPMIDENSNKESVDGRVKLNFKERRNVKPIMNREHWEETGKGETDAAKMYYEILEECAEEDEEIGEEEEGKKEKEEEGEEEEEKREDEEMTDILENSMANLWNENENKENIGDQQDQEGDMLVELEIDEDNYKWKENNKKEVKEQNVLGSKPNGYVSEYRASNYSMGNQRGYHNRMEMFSLSPAELNTWYIQMELKARKEFEKNQKKSTVEVVSSHENVLKGVVFSLSGFSGDEKKQFKHVGVSMGARYLDELYEGLTTHLVVQGDPATKYHIIVIVEKAKKMKNIKIVSREWIEKCYDQRKWLDEKDFVVQNLEEDN